MLARRVIPCLDVKDGRVVKGVQFSSLRDAGDAVELAALYDREGADELAFLDITASSQGRGTMVEMLERVAEKVFIPLTAGGGVTSVEDVGRLLRAGADKVAINTAAVLRPEVLSQASRAFGSQCIVLAIDAARDEGGGYEVFTHGGSRGTGLDAVEWAARGAALGAGEILLTSIDEDGRQEGYEIDLTRLVSEAVGVPVIASGGAGSPQHVVEVLTKGRADAALLASQLHYGSTSMGRIKEAMRRAGLPVRGRENTG